MPVSKRCCPRLSSKARRFVAGFRCGYRAWRLPGLPRRTHLAEHHPIVHQRGRRWLVVWVSPRRGARRHDRTRRDRARHRRARRGTPCEAPASSSRASTARGSAACLRRRLRARARLRLDRTRVQADRTSQGRRSVGSPASACPKATRSRRARAIASVFATPDASNRSTAPAWGSPAATSSRHGRCALQASIPPSDAPSQPTTIPPMSPPKKSRTRCMLPFATA